MEKKLSRVHRLALPLVIERKGSILSVSDGIFGHDFEFRDFDRLKILGVDEDGGFVTFEVSIGQQQTLVDPSSPKHFRATDVGFVSFGTGTAKSSSGSTSRGMYEYFKRPSDEYYYTLHKLGSRTKKIHLGSLQDPKSSIRQIAYAIQTYDDSSWFDRKSLVKKLTSSLSHGQKLKSVLDILVIEGFLERKETQKRGKSYEEYKKTTKLQMMK
jgi:hypothetical protein